MSDGRWPCPDCDALVRSDERVRHLADHAAQRRERGYPYHDREGGCPWLRGTRNP